MKLQVLSCLLCVVIREGLAVLKLKDRVGANLSITCSHSWATTNIKYLCRWDCTSRDVLIKSNGVGKIAQSRRYSLYDRGGGRFTFTITDLWKSDSGRYWCGVERSGADTFEEFFIEVLDAPPVTTPPQASTSRSEWKYYIPACVFAAFLIVLLSLTLHSKSAKGFRMITACFSSCNRKIIRGAMNNDPEETSPGDPTNSVYQNMEPRVSQSNPVYIGGTH